MRKSPASMFSLVAVLTFAAFSFTGCSNSQPRPTGTQMYSVPGSNGNVVTVSEIYTTNDTWSLQFSALGANSVHVASRIQAEFKSRHGNIEVTDWVPYISNNGYLSGYTVHVKDKNR